MRLSFDCLEDRWLLSGMLPIPSLPPGGVWLVPEEVYWHSGQSAEHLYVFHAPADANPIQYVHLVPGATAYVIDIWEEDFTPPPQAIPPPPPSVEPPVNAPPALAAMPTTTDPFFGPPGPKEEQLPLVPQIQSEMPKVVSDLWITPIHEAPPVVRKMAWMV